MHNIKRNVWTWNEGYSEDGLELLVDMSVIDGHSNSDQQLTLKGERLVWESPRVMIQTSEQEAADSLSARSG